MDSLCRLLINFTPCKYTHILTHKQTILLYPRIVWTSHIQNWLKLFKHRYYPSIPSSHIAPPTCSYRCFFPLFTCLSLPCCAACLSDCVSRSQYSSLYSSASHVSCKRISTTLCSFDIISAARHPPASWVLISSGTDDWYTKAEHAPRERPEPAVHLCHRQFAFIVIQRNSQALWDGILLRMELLPFPGEVGQNATVMRQQMVDDYRLWCAPNINGWQLICLNVDLIDIKPKLLSFLNALHSVMKGFWN